MTTSGVTLALVVQHGQVPAARATVRSALMTQGPHTQVVVTALCSCYRPVGRETVLTAVDVGLPAADVSSLGAMLEPGELATWVLARTVRRLLEAGRPVVGLRPGMRVLGDLDGVTAALGTGQRWGAQLRSAWLASRADGLVGLADRLGQPGHVHDPDLVVLGGGSLDVADVVDVAEDWCRLTAGGFGTAEAVDVVAGLHPHQAFRGAELVLGPDTLPHAAAVDVDPGPVVRVDGRPTTLLDLSRTDPATPWLIDANAAPPTVRLSDHPRLADLVARLLEAQSADTAPGDTDHPGPFAVTTLGTAYDGVLRTLVQAGGRRAFEEHGSVPPDPFDPEQSEQLRAWLGASVPAGDPFGVPRYLAGVYAARPDLRSAFPAVPGRDAARLVAWAARHGWGDAGEEPALLAAAVAAAGATGASGASTRPEAAGPRPRRRQAGVNLVGYLGGELGIGESARLVRTALETAQVPVAVRSVATDLRSRSIGQGPQGPGDGSSVSAVPLRFDTTLLCVNAAQLPSVAAEAGDTWAGTRRIGYWYWEVEAFPESQHVGFRSVDEVWVATEFVRRAVAPHAPVPVVTLTPPLFRPADPTTPTMAHLRSQLGLPPGRPVVLFVFDYLSTVERKNPWGAVTAYQRAFPPGGSGTDRPALVLKSMNAAQRPQDAERLRLMAAGDPDIVLLEQHLPAAQLQGLVTGCDAYLSLHRSEGLGLTIADAMSAGRPVVATGYGGNMEFMGDDTAYVVPWSPVPIPPGCEPYPTGTPWAEPDLDAAADALRRIIAEPTAAAQVGRRAAEVLRRQHAPEIAGARMRTHLDATRWTAPHRWGQEARAEARRLARRLRSEARDRLG